MASAVAWLDGSREEQRRVQELLRLIETAESRDELGIGQIRDAFGTGCSSARPCYTRGRDIS